MLQVIAHPERKDWPALLARPQFDATHLKASVNDVLSRVKSGGDTALREFTARFDGVELTELQVSAAEIQSAVDRVDETLRAAIATAAANIRKFHEVQLGAVQQLETQPGVLCMRKSVGIEKVGLYIPGGTAPLFSTVLMLGIPAAIAGCREIVLCTPPDRSGNIHPAILFAAQLTGITTIFKCGGAQAIAAMAYGTESIPKCYKIW